MKALFICLLTFVSYNMLAQQELDIPEPNYQDLDSFLSIAGHVLNLEQTEKLVSLKNTKGKVNINGVVFEYKNNIIKIGGDNYKIDSDFYWDIRRQTKFVRKIQSMKSTNGFTLIVYNTVVTREGKWYAYNIPNHIIFFEDGTLLFYLDKHYLQFGQFGKQWIIDNVEKACIEDEPFAFDVTNYTINLDKDVKHTLTLNGAYIRGENYVILLSEFFKYGNIISKEKIAISDAYSLIKDLEAIKN